MKNTENTKEFLDKLENAFNTVQSEELQTECTSDEEFLEKMNTWINTLPKYSKGQFLVSVSAVTLSGRAAAGLIINRVTATEAISMTAAAIQKLSEQVINQLEK